MKNDTAADLVARSISHTEIAHADYSYDLDLSLRGMVDMEDSVCTGARVEYWGTDDDGNEWRVHLQRTDESPKEGTRLHRYAANADPVRVRKSDDRG